jgi:hypothetical protein
VYEFNTTKKELADLARSFMARATEVLDSEGVTYNTDSVAQIIIKHAPDWRRVLNELQRHSIGGTLSNVSFTESNSQFQELFQHLKTKDFKKMRTWVVNNLDVEAASIFRGIYDNMNDKVQPQSIPQLVLILADYQYKNAFVADHEINIVACMTEIMSAVEFK